MSEKHWLRKGKSLFSSVFLQEFFTFSKRNNSGWIHLLLVLPIHIFASIKVSYKLTSCYGSVHKLSKVLSLYYNRETFSFLSFNSCYTWTSHLHLLLLRGEKNKQKNPNKHQFVHSKCACEWCIKPALPWSTRGRDCLNLFLLGNTSNQQTVQNKLFSQVFLKLFWCVHTCH